MPGVSCPSAGGCDALFDRASERWRSRLLPDDGKDDRRRRRFRTGRLRAGRGQTRLVSTGNSVNLGPATPVLERTSPDSPNASTTPAIIGQSDPNTVDQDLLHPGLLGGSGRRRHRRPARRGGNTGDGAGRLARPASGPRPPTKTETPPDARARSPTNRASPPPPPPPEEPPSPPSGGTGSGGTAGSGGSGLQSLRRRLRSGRRLQAG